MSSEGVLAATRRFIERLTEPTRILVAVSGGSDSTGLLLALSKTVKPPHSLCAATVDHGLRARSADEAEAVAALCQRLGIAHITLLWHGAKPKSGLSAAARLARYRLLKQAADHFAANLIVMAHTADDQDETIAMRAARGAISPRGGLSGMAEAVLYERTIWIARPFLGLRRMEIRTFLQTNAIGWIDDPTNADRHYERVRVRQALRMSGSDAPLTDPGALERADLARQAAFWVSAHASLHHGSVLRIERAAGHADLSVLNFALAGLVAVIGGKPDGVRGEALARLCALFQGGAAGRMTLGRVLAVLNRDGLFLVREGRGLPDPVTLAPGEACVWDGRFHICNENVFPVVITRKDGASARAEAGISPSLVRLGLSGLPNVCGSEGEMADGTRFFVALAPYDLFLPGFDLAYAEALAALLGLPPYLRPAFS